MDAVTVSRQHDPTGLRVDSMDDLGSLLHVHDLTQGCHTTAQSHDFLRKLSFLPCISSET